MATEAGAIKRLQDIALQAAKAMGSTIPGVPPPMHVMLVSTRERIPRGARFQLIPGIKSPRGELMKLMCAGYEKAHPDRVMWAAGEGGTPPPGFFFDEPKGDWDMSALNIDVAERERYETDRAFKLTASAELRDYITKEVGRRQRGIERYREGVQSDNPEYRAGSASFLRNYERELRILQLAQHALGMNSPTEAPAPRATEGK